MLPGDQILIGGWAGDDDAFSRVAMATGRDDMMEITSPDDLGTRGHDLGSGRADTKWRRSPVWARCNLRKREDTKDAAELERAAAMYAAAHVRCADPNMAQAIEHRFRYMEKLRKDSRQDSGQHQDMPAAGTPHNSVLKAAETCQTLHQGADSTDLEDRYTHTLVRAIADRDAVLEVECLKSLGDLYLRDGKTRADTSQLQRAKAMYHRARSRCESPDGKQALVHRVKVTEKLQEVATKVMLKHKKVQLNNDLPVSTKVTSSDSTEGVILKELYSQYDDQLQNGDEAVRNGDLDSAEQHFAAALRLVHVRNPTDLQYEKEVPPLQKLGDVYCRRGCQTGDGGDFVKAAALYQAAVARSGDVESKGNLKDVAKETETLFIKHTLLGIPGSGYDGNGTSINHKDHLFKIRNQIKQEMETIDKELNPYIHDEESQLAREIEAERADAVRRLFERIAGDRKVFIGQLVDECIAVMGPPPCKYALIGLGSQATGLVVNLGETILPAMGIKSLNDFYSDDPLDNWFYDSVTPRWFAFDGSMPKASKTPLGRQGPSTEPPMASELIRTPRSMAGTLEKDISLYLKEGYHLANVLRNVCLIAGQQGLVDDFDDIVAETLQSNCGEMARRLAEETLRENLVKTPDQGLCDQLLDVKKQIYRFPSVAVDCLALFSNILPSTVWKTVEEMKEKEVLSAENAHHLNVLNTAHSTIASCLSNLGSAWRALGEHQAAINYTEQALQMQKSIYGETTAHPDIATSLNNLGASWHDLNPKRAVLYLQQGLEMTRALYGDVHLDIAVSLKNLGFNWGKLSEHKKAIPCLAESLLVFRRIYGPSTPHKSTASALHALATLWSEMGNRTKALDCFEQALQMYRDIHGSNTAHSDIASLLDNLGTACNGMGDHRKALDYSHTDIVTSLSDIAAALVPLGDYVKAADYIKQAHEMKQQLATHD
uniref:Uncharacterized protein n=1 Tax=Branchiostoma floridae TaxID=7739 RepID=C3ZWR8_BRAFL|eukprot:XP_002586976.1 hypothetical protein BRAFLDRAFT_102097 [Branchiostoma floridae]